MTIMSGREFRLRLYGHRGAPAHLPENTLEAFERALADGANSLEIDVHPTCDGHFMVAHDPDGQRMAGVAEDIKSSTLHQVKKWNVAVGTGRNDLEPHTMPTLAETFEAFPDLPMSVDLKPDDLNAVAPLMELVARYGAEERTTLASFSTRVVRKMRRLGYPGRTTLSKSEVAVLRYLPRPLAKLYVAGNAAHIPVEHHGIRLDGQRFIQRCRSLGLRVDYWVVDDPEEARRLLDLGATGIMSDDPALIAPVFDDYR
jgi:glycerophosphoryl diester phosphodiesterase